MANLFILCFCLLQVTGTTGETAEEKMTRTSDLALKTLQTSGIYLVFREYKISLYNFCSFFNFMMCELVLWRSKH